MNQRMSVRQKTQSAVGHLVEVIQELNSNFLLLLKYREGNCTK
jgi:hypothetical protein